MRTQVLIFGCRSKRIPRVFIGQHNDDAPLAAVSRPSIGSGSLNSTATSSPRFRACVICVRVDQLRGFLTSQNCWRWRRPLHLRHHIEDSAELTIKDLH